MKKAEMFVRLLCAVLTICTVCSLLVACTGADSEGAITTADTGGGTGVEITPPAPLSLGHSIKLLYTKEKINGVVGEEESQDMISRVTWERWKRVEEDINTEITWNGMKGTGWYGSQPAEFTKELENAQLNSGDPYHAILCYNLYPGMLANKGLLQNLHGAKYIQEDMPWWPQIYIEELTVNNALYCIAENSNRETISNLHGVFFNNKLIDIKKLEKSPYDMVEDNTWTFANMMALIKDTYFDKNDNGKKDGDDFFGLMTGTEAKIEVWFFSMGYRYAQKDENGSITLNLTDTNYMTDWIDQFNAAHKTDDFLIHDPTSNKAFLEERSILYATSVQLVDAMVKGEYDIDYGVVPFPKKDSQQENYISVVSNHHVVWCVPVEVDLDESSGIMEWMAYEAYRVIAPVYFEQCIKLRYAPDERLAGMYDLIRATLAVDLCQLYTVSYSSGDPRSFITQATDGGKDWVNVWSEVEAQFKQEFSDILKKLYGM